MARFACALCVLTRAPNDAIAKRNPNSEKPILSVNILAWSCLHGKFKFGVYCFAWAQEPFLAQGLKLKLRLRACFACLHDLVCFSNRMSDTHEQTTVSELPAILLDGQRDASRITNTDVVDTDGVSPELLDDPSTAAESMGRLLKNRVALAVSFTTRTSDTKEFFKDKRPYTNIEVMMISRFSVLMVGTTLAANACDCMVGAGHAHHTDTTMLMATSDIYKTGEGEFDDAIAGRVELEIVRMIEVREHHRRMNQTYLEDSKKMNIKGRIKNNTPHSQELNGPLQHCMKMTKEEDNRRFKGEESKSELRVLFQSSTGGIKMCKTRSAMGMSKQDTWRIRDYITLGGSAVAEFVTGAFLGPCEELDAETDVVNGLLFVFGLTFRQTPCTMQQRMAETTYQKLRHHSI